MAAAKKMGRKAMKAKATEGSDAEAKTAMAAAKDKGRKAMKAKARRAATVRPRQP